MKRIGLKAMTMAAILGTSAYSQDAWIASTAKPADPPRFTSAEMAWKASHGTLPKANDVWRPIQAPLRLGDSEWQPTRQPRVTESSSAELRPPVVVEFAPADEGLTPVVMQVPVIDPTPEPPKPMKAAEPLPKEMPKPTWAPIPAPSAPPPVTAAPAMKTEMIAEDESTAMWGRYSNSPRTEASPVPVHHGAYGSPALRLSRDYKFLQATMQPIVGDEEQSIYPEQAAAAANAFVSAEYLLWWMNNGNIPVLASTASSHMFGYLGAPGTQLLLGPGSFGSTSPRSGLRLRAGTWFHADHSLGLDASFFFLSDASTSVRFGSDQFPTIARPFFAPNFGREFSELVAFPGLSTGSLLVEQTSSLYGFDVNVKCCRSNSQWTPFAGFRNVNLNETLTITEFLTAGPTAPDPINTRIVVRDRFEVMNSFYGGQIGGSRNWRYGEVSLDLRGSLALGATHQTLTIEGSQAKTLPGGSTQVFTGGLLAVGPNLGTFDRTRFSVVPEATLAMGYYVRPNVKVFAGYNFLGWTNVLRPGDQIDRVVDLTFVPNAPNVPFSGQPRPQPVFKSTDLVIHGLTFGLEGSW